MDQANSLALARIVVGASSWIAPEASLKASMLDPTPTQAPFIMRLFGAREIALGAVTLLAKPAHKPALLRMGLAVDSADAAAALMALKEKRLQPPQAALLAGMAGAGVVAGLVGLGQQRKA